MKRRSGSKPIGEWNGAVGLRGRGNLGHDIGGRDRIEWKRGRVLSAGGEGRQLRRGS